MLNVNNDTYQQFQTVFRQYYGSLCNYALSFLKDVSTSEDIVQDVFVRILEMKQEIINSEGIRFYLFTAVRNNCLTYLQKGKNLQL